MQFIPRRRRQAPAVIIISLIDVLIVLLIFLMVTTTFKQHPSVKLALPESKQHVKEGSSEDNLVITISKDAPYFYAGTRAVTLEKLQEELMTSVKRNPKIRIAVRSDRDASVGNFVKVMDAATAAGVRQQVSVITETAGKH
jgi:biopolymer transport protein ExbD